jgi:hypothetical protein
MSIIIWLDIHCYSIIRLHFIVSDIFQPFFELLDQNLDKYLSFGWCYRLQCERILGYLTQPVEAMSGQLLQFFKNFSQRSLDFSIFVKTFEKHLRKLSWIIQQDFLIKTIMVYENFSKKAKTIRLCGPNPPWARKFLLTWSWLLYSPVINSCPFFLSSIHSWGVSEAYLVTQWGILFHPLIACFACPVPTPPPSPPLPPPTPPFLPTCSAV